MHPPAPPLRLTELGQIGLNVNKLSVSVPFYRDVLGIPYLFSAPPSLAFFQVGTVRLMLAEPETPGEPARPNSPLYFKVPDVHTARHELTARGATFLGAPHCVAKLPDYELWMTFLHDPDQNLIGLMSEIRNSQ